MWQMWHLSNLKCKMSSSQTQAASKEAMHMQILNIVQEATTERFKIYEIYELLSSYTQSTCSPMSAQITSHKCYLARVVFA